MQVSTESGLSPVGMGGHQAIATSGPAGSHLGILTTQQHLQQQIPVSSHYGMASGHDGSSSPLSPDCGFDGGQHSSMSGPPVTPGYISSPQDMLSGSVGPTLTSAALGVGVHHGGGGFVPPSSSGGPPPSGMIQSHTPTSSDACASIVHCLMHYHTGREEEFSRKAVESLIKKLKDKRDELDSLITAVMSNGKTATKCVTIQRTLDGRLQVAGRKGFPHVVYAKVWRWPDLHKNELKHNPRLCQYAFDLKADLVCVNPYHYERVVSPGFPAELDLAHLRIDANNSNAVTKIETDGAGGVPSVGSPQQGPLSTEGRTHPPSVPASQISPPGGGGPGDGDSSQLDSVPSRNIAHGSSSGQSGSGSGDMAPGWPISPSGSTSTVGGGTFQQPGPGVAPPPQQAFMGNNSGSNNWNSPGTPGGAGNLAGGSSGTNFFNPPQQQQQQQGQTQQQAASLQQLENDARANVQPLTIQPPPDNWCTIAYYELDTQVGETFRCPSSYPSLVVDGGVDPSAVNRFCLGALSNVHRSEDSEKTRQYIGKGILLELKGEGDVWIECISEKSVYVQSYYLDREAGRAPGDAVHKIYSKARLKIFDLRQCYNAMKNQAVCAQAAAAAQAAAVAGFAQSSNIGMSGVPLSQAAAIGVDDLRRLCVLKISFVKGFGPDYPRNIIKETPCWIEIQLNRALQLLDEVLHTMPGLST